MALILPRYLGNRDEVVSEASRLVAARVTLAETFREKGVNVFRCPVCHKLFRYDDEYEPACTGPNETTDDHPMTVMEYVRTEPRLVMLVRA